MLVDDKGIKMTVFSVWAGIRFLGVFSTMNRVNEVYAEYVLEKGEFASEMTLFETVLDNPCR